MIIFAIAVVVLLLIVALTILLPAKAGIEYLYQGGRQTLVVHILCLGIPIKFRVPIGKKDKKSEKKKKAKATDEPKKKMTISRFCDMCKGICEAYGESKADAKEIIKSLRENLEFETVAFRVHFGLSDAAKTGIATGAAWTSVSCLMSALNQMFGIKKPELDVAPDFNRECFNLYIKSILIFRPVHIISIGLKIFKVVNLFIEKMDHK